MNFVTWLFVFIGVVAVGTVDGDCGPDDSIQLGVQYEYSGTDCPGMLCFDTSTLPSPNLGVSAVVDEAVIDGDDELCALFASLEISSSIHKNGIMSVVCGLKKGQEVMLTGICGRQPNNDTFSWGVCPRSGVMSKPNGYNYSIKSHFEAVKPKIC